jgi:hypothetical protein
MEKFLFTDGYNVVKTAESQEELESWIESSQYPASIRIWIYSSHEWISLAAYRTLFPLANKKQKNVSNQSQGPSPARVTKTHWSKKLAFTALAAASVLLIFNFTRINWKSSGLVNFPAARPDNVPQMDIDSLIREIEFDRGQSLDRSTRTNLRLRNTWPERILLQATAEKETSSAGSRFSNLSLSVDNTTGFPIDKAIVKLILWKNNRISDLDTFHFNRIRYDKIATRKSDEYYKADSLSLEFESIKAKAFNFSYSSMINNPQGEYTDRWFNRE